MKWETKRIEVWGDLASQEEPQEPDPFDDNFSEDDYEEETSFERDMSRKYPIKEDSDEFKS